MTRDLVGCAVITPHNKRQFIAAYMSLGNIARQHGHVIGGQCDAELIAFVHDSTEQIQPVRRDRNAANRSTDQFRVKTQQPVCVGVHAADTKFMVCVMPGIIPDRLFVSFVQGG